MRDVSPGNDEVPVPPPMDEVPPFDRFCDLVMTGGVASGVVYPWAIVEIARHYRFRSIGGTSVGAMAAALAAAAEYGRRVGHTQSFEVLRRLPGALGEVLPDGRTRMLSLFQANARGRRLVKLWGLIGSGRDDPQSEAELGKTHEEKQRKMPRLKRTFASPAFQALRAYLTPIAVGALWGLIVSWRDKPQSEAASGKAHENKQRKMPPLKSTFASAAREVLWAYLRPIAVGAIWGWLVSAMASSILLKLLVTMLGGLAGLMLALWRDVRFGLIENNLGLCKGGTHEPDGPEGKRPGLCEWLHEGIQASAGLKKTDRPLTFRDLWCAPAAPGAPHLPCAEGDPPSRRSINLQLITTNVTHGRPYRLPLDDSSIRFYYKPEDLTGYFPVSVIEAMKAKSQRYEKKSDSDLEMISDANQFFELPREDLPLVVAARMSLSFPLLFSAVPLWAVDYEASKHNRHCLRRCLFVDGGASSNFPVHLFDAAMPKWPTFGMWLDQKHPNRPPRPRDQDQDVWLPEHIGKGWGDNWDRFDPEATDPNSAEGEVRLNSIGSRLKFLFGFLGAIGTGMKDWRDLTSMRLPHMRNRVARLRLERGEGGLHIGMSRGQILSMAHRYGTVAGKLFVERYANPTEKVARAWSEQRWVRLALLIDGLKERLDGLKASAELSAYTKPFVEAIKGATIEAAIKSNSPSKSKTLSKEQADSLQTTLDKLTELEAELQQIEEQSANYFPKPELRLRAPL